MVISPASHFIVASMFGDGHTRVASGLNTNLCDLPEGFSQQTILGAGSSNLWLGDGKNLPTQQNLWVQAKVFNQ